MRLLATFLNRRVVALFFLILSLAVILRFYQLGAVPVGTYWDETAILLDAKLLSLDWHDMHGLSGWQAIFPSYGDYKLPIYIWLSALSVRLFGATAFAVRFPSAVVGVLTVGLVAALWKSLVKKPATANLVVMWGGIIAAAILAISPWSLQFSRTAFEGHVGQFLLGLSVWCLMRTHKNWRWGIVSAVVGALAVYSYYSVRFVWPGLLVVSAVLAWLSDWQASWQKQVKLGISIVIKTVAMGAIFWLCLLPLLRSPSAAAADQFRLSTRSVLNSEDWAIKSNILREQAGNHVWDRVFYHRDWLMAQSLLANYAQQLDLNYLFFQGDPNLRHGTGRVGLFYWWLLPALFVGGYWWLTEKPKTAIFLVSWWLLALLPASVPMDVPHALRSLNALIPITLILAAGMAQLLQSLLMATQKLPLLRWSVVMLGMGVVAATGTAYLQDYYGNYAARSVVAWQGGYQELAQKIVMLNTLGATTWVETGDEKFYLWLMLQLDPAIARQETNYLMTQIGPYYINKVDWKAVVYDQTPMLVVMQTSALDLQLKERNLQPSWIVTEQTFPNQLSYSIAAFRWPGENPLKL